MSFSQQSAVVLSDVSFEWPDGSPAFGGLSAAFGAKATGVTGRNGAGKTTLLRLIAGDLQPTSGTIRTVGTVGYLPQQLDLCGRTTVAQLLGVETQLTALRAIQGGSVAERDFETVGDAWDVDTRANLALSNAGLTGVGLDRSVETLSGGEVMLAALVGLQMAGHDVLLLDEPTNSLDRRGRHALYDACTTWGGALIVVSHDVTLLNLMGDTAELHGGSLCVFGGNYDEYRVYVQEQQEAAEQALRSAEQHLKVAQRQRREAQITIARRERYAATDFRNKRKPKMVMNARKREAQVSAGKLRGQHADNVEAARELVNRRAEAVRRDNAIAVTLPDPHLARTRQLVELRDRRGGSYLIQGPERLALMGRNGIGKTQLLQGIVRSVLSPCKGSGSRALTDRIGYLPQRLDHIDDEATILDVVRRKAPSAELATIRSQLARFVFRRDEIYRTVGSLSGGERLRVALASLLLADPANQLLLLDEPTNNLDLETVEEVVSALSAYRGALLVVSHDDALLARLGIDRSLTLDDDGLHECEAPGR